MQRSADRIRTTHAGSLARVSPHVAQAGAAFRGFWSRQATEIIRP